MGLLYRAAARENHIAARHLSGNGQLASDAGTLGLESFDRCHDGLLAGCPISFVGRLE